jgi:predicted glutamine amidotransferase
MNASPCFLANLAQQRIQPAEKSESFKKTRPRMCELLAMSCKKPAAINFSFNGFAERGGRTGEHSHGWGIAFFEGENGCRMFIDNLPAAESPLAELVKRYPIKSSYVIAHIRKATQGVVTLENCHPFTRELWGKSWIFVHNGDLKNFNPTFQHYYRPIGATDSEKAFCFLLNRLRSRFPDPPPLAVLSQALAQLAAEIAEYGTFNFMLSNGKALFTHCSTHLHYVTRQYPFATAKLVDCDMSIDFSTVNERDDLITVIATQPLTENENWHAFKPGEFKVFENGCVCDFSASHAAAMPLVSV